MERSFDWSFTGNSYMKTDKEIADELDARDRLIARGWKYKKCLPCGGTGQYFRAPVGKEKDLAGSVNKVLDTCACCGGKGHGWIIPLEGLD